MTKVCTKCNIEKEVKYFYSNKTGKLGLMAQCKQCHCKNVSDRTRKNKEVRYNYNKDYYKKNRDSLLSRAKQYANKNRNQVSEYMRVYTKKRRSEDIEFKIMCSLRARTCAMLRGENKSASTKKLLGCTYEKAHQHIEAQFTAGMSWDNHGVHGWHIDHIVPCASFDLTDPEQQRQCFHYTNLQPLWAKDNIRKSDKMPHQLSQTKGGERPASTTTK